MDNRDYREEWRYKYYIVECKNTEVAAFKTVKAAKEYVTIHSKKSGLTYKVKRNNKEYGIYHWDPHMGILVSRRAAQ